MNAENAEELVSIFDAKTHLSGLVDEVCKHNKEYVITRHGQRVAKIVPVIKSPELSPQEVVDAMLALGSKAKPAKTSLEDILAMRDEGRR